MNVGRHAAKGGMEHREGGGALIYTFTFFVLPWLVSFVLCFLFQSPLFLTFFLFFVSLRPQEPIPSAKTVWFLLL